MLLPSGQLLYKEADVKVEFMQQSLLRWRGEWSMVPGMMVSAVYEPGADRLTVTFIPPPEDQLPEEAKKNAQLPKSPQTFVGDRVEPPEDYILNGSNKKWDKDLKAKESGPAATSSSSNS